MTRSSSGRRSGGPGSQRLFALTLTAIGVVYGDIGTSPLYTMRECFQGPHAMAVTRTNVLGILSLIIWSLIAIVSVKYLCLVLRADNKGEGGILSPSSSKCLKRRRLRSQIRTWQLVARLRL